MAQDRYIRYADVNRDFIAIPRATFHGLVRAHAFGPNQPPWVLRLGGKEVVMVLESMVKKWIAGGCRSTHQLIKRRMG